MATQSIQKDIQGPDWPLGLIVVAAAGTPVPVMSLVDPSNAMAPNTPVSATNPTQYTPRANQIMFQGMRAGSHGLQNNQGNVYIMRQGVQGAGNRDDYGSMVMCLVPGQTVFLAAAAVSNDVYSPYRYFIDADNNSDGVLATLFIG